ncbi:transmembrane 4 L6 family member 4-like [Seriola lalandi dorsalis]|uniref:transmembrane 4 L6 family member 4-like n=1 Tax=Seriola lalandi dorsalis TaxID=1841481 RepID=UPI000C6F8A6A|nr:transmembrane 4 L6 family member 4-like [Seriola lalandi dorsalis]
MCEEDTEPGLFTALLEGLPALSGSPQSHKSTLVGKILFPALYIHQTGQQGRCGNRFGMFLSIVFASVGVSGALYSFSVAAAGLLNGPLCKVNMTWTTPFKNSNFTHLSGDTYWQECTEPKNVVQFNMGLFITLIAASSLQGLLCAIQMISGLFGCLCGTGNNKERP